MSENNNKQKENNIENNNNNKINNNSSNSNETSSNFSNNNNNNNNNNNKNNIPKFEILTDGSDLLKLIKNHFNNLEIDNDKVIEKFMRIEKEQTNEKNNSMRKSIRYQEKAIAKFLDNFVSN